MTPESAESFEPSEIVRFLPPPKEKTVCIRCPEYHPPMSLLFVDGNEISSGDIPFSAPEYSPMPIHGYV